MKRETVVQSCVMTHNSMLKTCGNSVMAVIDCPFAVLLTMLFEET